MGSERTGFYSLIQYSESPESYEFVNIGVVLFSEQSPFVTVRMTEKRRRVEQFFGKPLGRQFKAYAESLKDRLVVEFSTRWDRSSVEKFVALRSGKFRLSALRPILVQGSPSETVDILFESYVSELKYSPKREPAKRRLRVELDRQGALPYLEARPKPVMLRGGVTIKAPFAYQNGSYNLIEAVSLTADPDQAISGASKFAIEGQMLLKEYESEKRLVLVGDLEGQASEFVGVVESLMDSHGVKFFTFQNIEPLIGEIRSAAAHRD